ncbi:TonB-dependent receptor [Pseudoxanthomonas sp. SGD-10]|nr:TonB-dependent receptor [Pseudoxanthomonas sp. SGD-10]
MAYFKKIKFSLIITLLILLPFIAAIAQTKDSVQFLDEVTVKAYLGEQTLISLPASATILQQQFLEQRNVQSLLPSLNSVSGVKMEERSPGSYRLSIRGSLLRSSFGVRNLKVYYDDFPLTDAGGNTYLNLIDQNTIKRIEVLKGPDGSLFGANSGGVILLNSLSEKPQTSGGVTAGSYGLVSQFVRTDIHNGRHSMSINQAYQRADGFRENTAMNRLFLQTQQRWKYSDNATLKFSGFYADMDYRTPGGLNISQLQENPRGARANAKELNVGIANKSLFAGLSHEKQFSDRFRHVIAASGIVTDFENPFFTNYETREEQSFALRTYIELKTEQKSFINTVWNFGWEYQNGSADIINHTNNAGLAGNVMAADKISNQTQFLFNRFAFNIGQRLKAEASVSLNFADIKFASLPQSEENITGKKRFDPAWMPRISASYLITPLLAARGIISRGYSLPTTAEVRANDARINPDLEPEQGWNYETGLRLNNRKQTFYVDAALFYYNLSNAIVRRINSNSEEYFTNAGGTQQKGLEIQANTNLYSSVSHFVKAINWNTAFTFSDFKFTDYMTDNNDYSGNRLTGIPKLNTANSLEFSFKPNLTLYIQHIYNGRTSLNDAETVFAAAYHLIQMKLNWEKAVGKRRLNTYIGSDNLLNERYSLGNDLNAFGARYFNPAANRSFFAGLSLNW